MCLLFVQLPWYFIQTRISLSPLEHGIGIHLHNKHLINHCWINVFILEWYIMMHKTLCYRCWYVLCCLVHSVNFSLIIIYFMLSFVWGLLSIPLRPWTSLDLIKHQPNLQNKNIYRYVDWMIRSMFIRLV